MRQENVNDYNQEKFKADFSQTDICKKIIEENDILVWHKSYTTWLNAPSKDITIRKKARSKIVPMSSFYYLQYLLEKDPKMIIDLGCGDNFFKLYIPQVYGIDGMPPNNKWFEADAHQLINDYWMESKKDTYESLMTINAIHFRPIEALRDAIILTINMVKAGGRGYMAFNVARLLEKCSIERFTWLNDKNRTNKSSDHMPGYYERVLEVEDYIRKQLYNLPANILVFDLDLTYVEDAMDGNLRIVFERC